MAMRRTTLGGLWAWMRRPEYTGEQRCWPCTTVNVGLAAVLVVATAAVSRPLALFVAVGALATIGLRGYLVPGTPELTARYLPDPIHDWFGTAPTAPVDDLGAFDVTGFLHRAGVLEEDGSDVALDWLFEAEVEQAAFALDDEATVTAAAAGLLGVAPSRLSFVTNGPAWRVLLDDAPVGQWESRAAFVADLAAHETLLGWTDEWAALPADARSRTLAAIRACLDTCPICAGEVRLGTDVVRSCCREHEVVAATCGACDRRLFEMDAAAIDHQA